MVECNLAKVEVAGSNPVSRSIFFTPHCGSNSAVECQLPKLKVAGSNPVSRSRNLKGLHRTMYPLFLCGVAAVPPMVLFRTSISHPAKSPNRNISMASGLGPPLYSGRCRVKQETPFRFMAEASICGNAGQKGQHHHRLRRKTDLCITFPHTVFFAAPRPVRGAPRFPSMYWKSWLLCIKRNETVFTPFLIFLPTGTS